VKPVFTLGRVVATPGALAAIGVSGESLFTHLRRQLNEGRKNGHLWATDSRDSSEQPVCCRIFRHPTRVRLTVEGLIPVIFRVSLA
jgi:hypothetical protein